MEMPCEETFIRAFDRKIRFSIRLNLFFILAIALEIGLFLFFTPFLLKSAFLAFAIALLFLTLFGYFLLRQYADLQKLAQFETLLNEFLDERKQENAKPQEHLEHAKICTRIAHRLYQREYKYLRLPSFLSLGAEGIERLSAWLFWRDVHKMRELLLQKAVDEQIEIVRKEPTNPDAHALLANAYVMLSGLYVKPQDCDRFVPYGKYGEGMKEQFQEAAKRAVEEFKILRDYSPNDPWIYMQLAYSYRDLQMPEEEKEAYQAILNLRPNDHDARFNLGMLYFKRGENSRGLREFEELKKANFNKADELLCIYGQRS